jgi:hypothetical protein
MQPLTKDQRRAVCVHEAGHAIIHALAGDYIYRIAVAPEGATEWTSESRKGSALTDLWGVCEPSDILLPFMFMTWDEGFAEYRVDRAGFRAMLKDLDRQVSAQGGKPGMRAGQMSAVRKALCGALAGPIAEALYLGQCPHDATDPYTYYERGHDISKAIAFARLLPGRTEYEHAEEQTREALLRPDVWAMTLRLADELQRVGNIEDGIEAYLPAPVPSWPPSPRVRTARPFVVRPLEL